MLEVHEIVRDGEPVASLELPFELRQKSRLGATLDSGESIAVFLPRGSVLRDGTLLRTTNGRVVRVKAAPEQVSTVSSEDPHLLTRVAYHLGNRHVPLQVSPGFLRYLHDHVLDDMVRQLGANPRLERAPFEPEAGAYGAGPHHHHQHDVAPHAHPHGDSKP